MRTCRDTGYRRLLRLSYIVKTLMAELNVNVFEPTNASPSMGELVRYDGNGRRLEQIQVLT